MNFQEMEELLYTDFEVRQEMEDVQRLRIRVKRRRRIAVAAMESAGIIRIDKPGNVGGVGRLCEACVADPGSGTSSRSLRTMERTGAELFEMGELSMTG